MVWDLTGRLAGDDKVMTPADLDVCWSDLDGEDAAKAYRAIRRMALSPAQSVPFIAERLKPAAAANPERVARLIAELDSDDFEVRKNAAKELQALAEVGRDQYEEALKNNSSAEARRQLEALIEAHKNQRSTGELLRGLRAIEALESAGTPEAQKALKALTQGARAARLTQDAKASLIRLSNRP